MEPFTHQTQTGTSTIWRTTGNPAPVRRGVTEYGEKIPCFATVYGSCRGSQIGAHVSVGLICLGAANPATDMLEDGRFPQDSP
jgi:hypothetical protein